MKFCLLEIPAKPRFPVMHENEFEAQLTLLVFPLRPVPSPHLARLLHAGVLRLGLG